MCGSTGIAVNVVFKRLLFTAAFLVNMTEAYAGDPYQLGQVDYFHDKDMAQSMEEESPSFDWREGANIPPGPMLTLLEHPSLENAEKYIAWQQQKAQKITKAQALVEQALKGKGQ